MEEPDLVKRQCHAEQGPGCDAVDERNERNEPDEVLRREEPCEREEACDRGGERDDEPLRLVPAARIEPRNDGDGRELERGEHRAERAR